VYMVKNDEKSKKNKFKEKLKIIKRIKIFDYGRHKFYISADKHEDNAYINVWKWGVDPVEYRGTLKLRKVDHWRLMKEAIDNHLAPLIGWDSTKVEISKIKHLEQKFKKEIEKKDRKLKQKDKEYRELMRTFSNLRKDFEATHLKSQKSRLPELKKAVFEFEKILEERQNETKVHKFLKDNWWMFGPVYVNMGYETWAGIKNRNDFLLQRIDGYHDIVELKGVDCKLFTKDDKWSKDLKDAVSKMMRYLSKYESGYLFLRDDLKKDVFMPRGMIVIGRARDEERKLLKVHNSYLHRINVITYDEILEKSKNAIKIYEQPL